MQARKVPLVSNNLGSLVGGWRKRSVVRTESRNGHVGPMTTITFVSQQTRGTKRGGAARRLSSIPIDAKKHSPTLPTPPLPRPSTAAVLVRCHPRTLVRLPGWRTVPARGPPSPPRPSAAPRPGKRSAGRRRRARRPPRRWRKRRQQPVKEFFTHCKL